jgi:hypothetical protein
VEKPRSGERGVSVCFDAASAASLPHSIVFFAIEWSDGTLPRDCLANSPLSARTTARANPLNSLCYKSLR